MEVEIEASPSYLDQEDFSSREQFRRYGKRLTTPNRKKLEQSVSFSRSKGRSLLYDGHNIHSPTNAALLLENIKQEADNYESATPFGLTESSSKRQSLAGEEWEDASWRRLESESIKACKMEDEMATDVCETSFGLFASLLDAAAQGLMSIPDLILRFEKSCRAMSESIRYGSITRQRVVEDKLVRHKAQLLIDEAATWSLMWHLYGKVTEEIPEELVVSPTTSHLETCEYVANEHTPQLCLRIIQWLEGLASKALDLESKVKGSHIGTYLPNSGIWHHTQRFLRKGIADPNTIQHLDFDAPTREQAHKLPADEKQDESLLEDVWTLLRAGRLEEACELCRSGGQSWRAVTLSPFGEIDLVPSVETLVKNGRNKTLQAIELESGIGHQWRLWKWASYYASEKIAEQNGGKHEVAIYASNCGNIRRMLPVCVDWESACWALAKSWLNVQVDLELARLQPGRIELLNSYGDRVDGSPGEAGSLSIGSESWPLQVLNQQPRNLASLLQKLHSGENVDEAVSRECKEQHRQIEMDLMMGNIPHMLDLIMSWIAPLENENISRVHYDSQMMRFGAHAVLVLRHLLVEEIKDPFRDKLMNVGDAILNLYAMFLFSKQHEELVGIYASQLARPCCVDLFVQMMELRLNSSVHVKYKLFLSAMEYLPFSPDNDSKGSFEEIVERVLFRSREFNISKCDNSSEVVEQYRLQSFQKAMVIQWLCFTPPSTINNFKDVSNKLLVRALMHSNILFREFALISMWRVPSMPVGAHALLSLLVEPLKHLSEVNDNAHTQVPGNLKEFQDWSEYYSCDANYRKWLQVHLDNSEIPQHELSMEEKENGIAAAKESLDSSLLLLQRRDNPWMLFTQGHAHESVEPFFIEVHATAMLFLPSGECICPDATICAALMSALYSSVTEDVVLHRQLMVNVAISSKENYCIELVLRCLAVEGDGVGSCQAFDGGLLGNVIASGFKGELSRFQEGVTMEISRLDSWYSSSDGVIGVPATYVVLGLCRRCCLPELILRCMEVCVYLAKWEYPSDLHDELIQLVTSSDTDYLSLFSQQQLQEFLLSEREHVISEMEMEEMNS